MSHEIYTVWGSSKCEEIPTFSLKFGESANAMTRNGQTAINHNRQDYIKAVVSSKTEALNRESNLAARLSMIPNAGGSGKEFYCFNTKRFKQVYEEVREFFSGCSEMKYQPHADCYSPQSVSSMFDITELPKLSKFKKVYVNIAIAKKFNLK